MRRVSNHLHAAWRQVSRLHICREHTINQPNQEPSKNCDVIVMTVLSLNWFSIPNEKKRGKKRVSESDFCIVPHSYNNVVHSWMSEQMGEKKKMRDFIKLGTYFLEI